MIDKLNGISVQTFTGNKKTPEKKLPAKVNTHEPKQVVVVSKKGADAMRNAVMATIAAVGLAATAPTMQSCSDDLDVTVNDSLINTLTIDYNPQELSPETLIVYKDSIVNDTIWQTDTIYKDSVVNDTVWQTDNDTVYVNLPGDTIRDTIYVDVPIYLPGDTIRDTIYVEKPGETVYIEPDYESEAADSLIAHCKNLGFDFDGEGTIPVRLNVFDQWNTTNHDLVFDGKASSEEKMVFIDEAKDYSKSSTDPEIRYNRIEFSPDYGRGLTNHLYKAPTAGVKPSSAAAWVEAAKTCNSYVGEGIIDISEYDDDGELSLIGNFEKSNQADIDFFENRFVEDDEIDTYNWTQAKVTLASPKK